MRQLLAVAAGGAAAALCAVIFGEQDLAGWVPLVVGVVVGVGVGEVVAAVARPLDAAMIGAAALLALASMAWAVWISSGHGIRPVDVTAWLGVFLAPAAAALWLRGGRTRGASTTPPSAP